MQPVNHNPSVADLHKFGWAMLFGFSVIGAICWYFGPEPNNWRWIASGFQKLSIAAWVLGPVLLLVSFGPRILARPVYIGWMTVAVCIGTVMTFIVLSVLFVVLLPVFSLIRLKDPLRLRLLGPGQTYWEDHKHHEATLERTIHPF